MCRVVSGGTSSSFRESGVPLYVPFEQEPTLSLGDKMPFRPDPYKGLTPEMKKKVVKIISQLITDTGQDWRIAQGYRSPADQMKVFKAGKSKARPGQSWHQYGGAVDLYPFKNNKIMEYKEAKGAYDMLGKLAATEGLTWGGTPGWGGPPGDYGHLNLTGPAPWRKGLK